MRRILTSVAAMSAIAAAPPETTPEKPAACVELVREAPGEAEQIQGVYFSFIDDDGFVPCATVAECKGFNQLPELAFEPTQDGWIQINEAKRPLQQNWGVFRIRFEGRRGTVRRADCADKSIVVPAGYVQLDRLISLERLADAKD